MKNKVMDVVAAVIWQGEGKEKKYLAQQRPLHYPMAGLWEFPGGKVDAGESHEDALRRELFEELQIVVDKMRFWQSVEHEYPMWKVRLHLYHVDAFSGQPQCVEAQNIRFIYPHEALSLNFLEADKDLVTQLCQEHGA